MVPREIFVDRLVIKASDDVRYYVLESEREQMRLQINEHYKQTVMDLQANILAY